ncbi:DNA translocase FtsK [Mesorhizobium sp. B3-2-1]|uniref:DNA translocase FtsK n=1 Tax=Mesorhizobium sp. B3-2-1 TaxID=2589891 RepID=UPI00112D7948|nr:DNA translocase FtsK [Mesorhizobium sp. B3-2-1]TPI31268.1 DNA translocase FtsK [Mesorhizobium sp. B3-2-1]
MEARRFSRVNSLHTASPDDPEGERAGGPRGKVDIRQPGDSYAGQSGRVADPRSDRQSSAGPNGKPAAGNAFPQGGDTESPAWQEYFFLAPNVRFTRTPDYEPKHRPPQDEVAGQGGPQALPTQQVGPGGVMHRGPSPAAPAQPARGGETSQGVPPAAPKVPARAATRPAPVGGNGAPVKTPPAEKVRRPYLSDHAFFEGLAPLLVDVTSPARSVNPVSRAPVAPPPVATVRADISAADVTALFRVIECLPGQAPSATPDVFPANSNEAVAVQPVPAGRAARQARTTAAMAPAASSALPAPLVQRAEEAVPAMRAPSLPMAGKVARPVTGESYELPSEELLQQPPEGQGFYMSQERLEQNADLLESVLEDFGVRGEIIHVRPGPVVTLYEFEPAPGVKSSRVIGLADDIARSMSAVSARVAVVPGRNVIGIELPNETRETVYFRELIESQGFRKTSCKLALCLGKTIGGEPVIAELAKMPHLLVAGTTGSGKSVAINTMILSLLYRLKPEECRLIMVDPKMLELSVYDGIPHLLTPVVTDPKKAVTALKWAVREMEDRYRKMARLGVRNIDGYNERAAQARDKGETVVMTVQAGFEKGTGEPLFEQQEIDLTPMPYIVVIVDEMADLMMVAGKEIEGAIQRLAQMARAAGIHLIMATQRPSVDVITGTIKANFPTRISFQVTSKIDSRTILGEQGAEQLLGQGDMLHMMGGGRIARVHGPFVSDAEVEHVVAHLKAQGRPEYLETVTADEDDEEEEDDQGAVFDKGAVAAEDGDSSYDEAVKVVLRDKKCSTSYIQRRLGIGYNRAASLVERMEKEGLVGAPNHVGKREIMAGKRPSPTALPDDGTD